MKKKEIHRGVEKDGGGAQLENSDYFVSLKQDLNPRPSNLKDDISHQKYLLFLSLSNYLHFYINMDILVKERESLGEPMLCLFQNLGKDKVFKSPDLKNIILEPNTKPTESSKFSFD